MSKAYVTEYGDATGGGNIQIAQGPGIRTQVVDFSGGAATTTLKFSENTRLVRVNVDATCSVAEGASAPAVSTSSKRMPADSTEYWGVRPGDFLAFIANT